MIPNDNSSCSTTCFHALVCTEDHCLLSLRNGNSDHRSRFHSTERWSVNLTDPISLKCDENLECPSISRVHNRNCRNTRSEYHEPKRSAPKSKIRSRSEEHGYQENESMLYDMNTPTSISSLSAMELRDMSAKTSCSCSDSNCCLAFSHSISSSGENATDVQITDVEIDNHAKSGPNSDCSSCSCSPESAVPPPMALINVKRLSLPRNSSIPDIKHHLCTEIPGSEHATSLHDSAITDLGIHSSKDTSSTTQIRKDISMTSSGTSSLSGTNAVMDELGPGLTPAHVPSSIPVGLNAFDSMLFGCTNTSARDSGLSSHSSNSAHFSPKSNLGETSNKTEDSTKLGVPITPPPVPPHGPASQAMAARMARIEQEQLNSSKETCTCSKRPSTQKLTSRVTGTTIRLIRYSGCCEQQSKVAQTHQYMQRGDQLLIMKNQSSTSPIWKRKMMLNSSTNSESHPSRNKKPTEQSCLFSPSIPTSNPVYNPTSSCLACPMAWQYYLSQSPCFEYFGCKAQSPNEHLSKFYKLMKSMTEMTSGERCSSCRKHLYAVGVNLFNRNPLKGLEFLNQHKFVRMSCVEDVARFLRTCPDLCRSKVGAFLGLPPTDEVDTTAILKSLMRFLNFTDLEVDEALRLLVYHYGMPVESQEIDRLLQCLTQHYFSIRWPQSPNQLKSIPAPISTDQLLLIFYAVLLLQTSLHNVNAAKSSLGKQTLSQFVKNVQSFLFNVSDNQSECSSNGSENLQHSLSVTPELLAIRKHTFSHNVLAGIYQRIKARPLTPAPDHTSQIRRISMAVVSSKDESFDPNKIILDNAIRPPNLFELTESHRRLVCYCAVIHIFRKQSKEVNSLSHMFLFNDLILIAKDAYPKKRAHPNRKSQTKHQYNESVFLSKRSSNEGRLNGNGKSDRTGDCESGDASVSRLSVSRLHPPLDLIRSNPIKPNSASNGTDSQMSTLERPTTACLPHNRRSRSKISAATLGQRPNSSSSCPAHYEPTRLVVIRNVGLDGCQVRPFRSSAYRYGLEIWKAHDYHSGDSNINPTDNTSPPSKRLLALCALTHTDYQNLLTDLADCLRESDRVQIELAKTRSKSFWS